MEYKKIGELFSYVSRGKSPKYVDNSDICIINQACIRWDGVDYTKVKYQDASSYREDACLHDGDIVLTSTGTGTLGRCCVFHRPDQRVYVADSHVTVLRGAIGIPPDILCLYLRTQRGQNKLYAECVNGSTNQIELSKEKLRLFVIPVPTMTIQRDLVSQTTHINKIIELRKTELFELDSLVKSRFVELFGDPETNPYGWKTTTVGDVCSSIVRGPFGSALKKEFFVEPNETTYKVYEQKHAIQKSATIGTYYVTAEKFAELRRFECVAGDILMSCSGTMGELYQLPEGCEKGLINQALCKFTLNKKILPIVFLTYMKQTIGNLETKGSGIQNIAAVSYVKAMPINLAPMEVQEQFAAFVEQTDKSKAAVQKALDEAQTLFDSLMQQYFG